uniref:F-box domain-containing protein n=1 Tax=Colletotrichum fructicola (strain Nara gc5) TaxID=1213859 RepID=L2G4F1_COLFN
MTDIEKYEAESTSQLENLPTEVLLQILAHIDDVHCLWNVITSSPASYRVFNQYSAEIFWQSISESTITPQTQDIICFVIQLRAGAHEDTGLDEIMRKIKDREAGIVLGKSEEAGYDFENRNASKVPSLGILRSVLSTAAQVHCLTRSCIDHNLQQLIDAKAKRRLEWAPEDERSRRPSWVEEQRVLRAFWRLQLIFELKLAVTTSRVRDTPGTSGHANDFDIQSFYDSSNSNLKVAYHEVMTAVEYVRHLARRRNNSDSETHRLPQLTWPAKDIQPSSRRVPTTVAMRRSSLVLPADGLWIVDSMSRGAHSPIKYAGFEPYRALGFAIWDRHRLPELGLASPPGHGRVTGLGSYFSYWLRLLDARDLAQAEEVMREVENQGGRLGPLQPMIQDNAS